MENIEKNEIITTEAIEDITEATTDNGTMLKTVGKIGAGLAAAALLTKFVLIPVGRKVIRKIRNKKATVKVNVTEPAEVDLDDMEIEDLPDVD